jgi:hypothetical protein
MSVINLAAWLGWRGSLDTDLKFSEFFFGDHTVMFRCMRQYRYAGAGPVIASTTGTYFLGQGDAGSGAVSKFSVMVGGQQQDYASDEGDRWIHVALVRSGNVFTLFLDGVKQSHPITISPADVQLPLANTTVRIGRAADGVLINGRESQFYGYVDDVAVFKRPLTHQEIRAIIDEHDHRLHGHQSHLVAAWIFDHTLPSGDPLPPSFSRPYQLNSHPEGKRAGIALVSEARDDAFDAKILHGIVPYQKADWIIPFDKGSIWVVVQGNNDPNLSHFGTAAFCWDFTLAGAPTPGKPVNPNGPACGERLHAVGDGHVFDYVDSGPSSSECGSQPTNDGGDWFHIELAKDEIVTYMHTLVGSIKEMHPHLPAPPPPAWAAGFAVNQGELMARVGSRCVNNCHLHIASQSANPNAFLSEHITGVTFPVAFSNYEVCSAGADFTKESNWSSIARGVPLVGQFVRRPKS